MRTIVLASSPGSPICFNAREKEGEPGTRSHIHHVIRRKVAKCGLMSMVCDAHKHSPVEHKPISLTFNTSYIGSSQGSPIRFNARTMIILCHPSPPFALLHGAHDFAYPSLFLRVLKQIGEPGDEATM